MAVAGSKAIYSNFSGGINMDIAEEDVKPNQMRYIMNMTMELGKPDLIKRNGNILYPGAAEPVLNSGNPIPSGWRFASRVSGSRYNIVSSGTKIFRCDDSYNPLGSFTEITPATTSIATGGHVKFLHWILTDTIYFVDGTVANMNKLFKCVSPFTTYTVINLRAHPTYGDMLQEDEVLIDLLEHNSRLFLLVGNHSRVYFSDIIDIGAIPEKLINSQGYPQFDGFDSNYSDLPQRIVKDAAGNIVVGKKSSWFIYQFQYAQSRYRYQINSKEGVLAPWSVINFKNQILYIGYDGIYALPANGLPIKISEDKIDSFFEGTVNYVNLRNAVAFADKSSCYFCVPTGNSTVNDFIIECNHNGGTNYSFYFHTSKLPYSIASAWSATGETDGERIYWGSNDGKVRRMNVGSSDEGLAIENYFITPYYHSAGLGKRSKFIDFWMQVFGEGQNRVDVTWSINYDEQVGSFPYMETSSNLTLWGGSKWGQGKWNKTLPKNFAWGFTDNAIGESIRYKFYNNDAFGQWSLKSFGHLFKPRNKAYGEEAA